MRRIAIALLIGSVQSLLLSFNNAGAQQVIQGDVKVAGTLFAESVQSSGANVLTTKDVSAIQTQVLKQVAEEIANRLKFNGNSPEMRTFAEQVTKAVAKTVGISNQDLAILRRDLNESSRSGAASVNEMRTAIANMQRAQVAAEREIAALRRELDQLRRDVN